MPPARRIRIYSPDFPFPPQGGSAQVIFDQVRALSELGAELDLVVWKDGDAEVLRRRGQAHVEGFPARVPTRCLEGGVGREGRREGFKGRIRRLSRVAGAVARGGASPEEFYYPSSLADAAAPEASPRAADLSIYHYSFAHSWLARSSRSPGSSRSSRSEGSRIVMFHNLESELSHARADSSRTPWEAALHRRNARILRDHEIGLLEMASELWFISPQDLETFLGSAPLGAAARCKLVPPGFSRALRTAREAAFQARLARPGADKTVVGFIGSLDFGPNEESARWLLERLAPILQAKAFRGELRIVGRGPSRALRERARAFPFVTMPGYIADAESFWADLSVSLVPHVSGSGVRMKLLESLASGIPVLANRDAVARIHPELRGLELLSQSDDPEYWASRILSQAAFEGRKAALGKAFPPALDGNQIYRFLDTK